MGIRNWFAGSAERHTDARLAEAPAAMEQLEPRLLLDAAEFVTALDDAYVIVPGGGGLTVGVDARDADGDSVTVSAVSDNGELSVFVPTGNRYARFHFVAADGVTAIGDIVVQLFEGRTSASTEQFITLATNYVAPDGSLDPNGTPFYTDVVVHRVIDDFMIQTGDAANGDGTGGSPLGPYADAFDPVLSFGGRGVLAMANSGPNSSDSQFFITEVPTTWLDQHYMIFGQIISGWDVLEAISEVPVDGSDRPIDTVLLGGIDIFEDDQDATITFQASAGFTGQASVTVSLDDGTGNVTEQVITVAVESSLGARPTISLPDAISTAAGEAATFIADIIDDQGLDVDVWAQVEPRDLGAVITVDQVTHEVSVTGPAGFTGMFQVTIFAVEADNLTPAASDSFYVLTHGEYDPVGLSRLATNANGNALSAFELDGRMYVANGVIGVEIFDVSDPADPVWLGTYDTPGVARHAYVIQTVIASEAATVAFVADTWQGVRVLDVTDPANVVELDSLDTGSAATSLALDGDTLFVPNWEGGLVAVNVADPTAIYEAGRIKQLTEHLAISTAAFIAVEGDYGYLVDSTGLALVIDVSDPANMEYVNMFAVGASWGIAVQNSRVYVTKYTGGLHVFDVSDPSAPLELGSLDIADEAWMVSVRGDVAAIGLGVGDAGFVFIDIYDPAAMSELCAFLSVGSAGQPSFFGNNVALPLGGSGVVLSDADILFGLALTTPASPSYVERGQTYRIEWSGGQPAETVQIWSVGPDGWNLLVHLLPATDGGYDWDTTGVPHGWYCFNAQINDGGEWYSSQSPNWVHVIDSANHAPTIEITNPATPQAVEQGDPFTIRWTAADDDGDTLHVSLWAHSTDTGWFQVDGAEWLDAAAGEFVWDTALITHGWYCFSAWVMDGSDVGVVGSPNFVHVELPPAHWPTFSFLTPASGASVLHGQSFELTWDAVIPTGEAMEVHLWAFSYDLVGNTDIDPDGDGWIQIATALDASAGTFSWDTSDVPPSWYSFGAWMGHGDVWIAVASDNWLEVMAIA